MIKEGDVIWFHGTVAIVLKIKKDKHRKDYNCVMYDRTPEEEPSLVTFTEMFNAPLAYRAKRVGHIDPSLLRKAVRDGYDEAERLGLHMPDEEDC